MYPMPILSMGSSIESDPLDTELFANETIMEVMCPIEKPWEISHHSSSFIPTTDQLKKIDLDLTIDNKFDWFKCYFLAQLVFIEGNILNISKTIPINISSNPDIIENIMIGVDCSPQEIGIYTTMFKEYRVIFAWSYEEMSDIALG